MLKSMKQTWFTGLLWWEEISWYKQRARQRDSWNRTYSLETDTYSRCVNGRWTASNSGKTCPENIWQCVETFLIAATEGSLQIYYVESSDAAKHLSMPRTASTTRNCPSPNIQSGKVESESVSHSVMFVIPMDCRPPGSSVHGVLRARILEWVAIHFSRGSSQSRDQSWVSCITGRLFTIWATMEAQCQGWETLGQE